jgi:hypothetical protein
VKALLLPAIPGIGKGYPSADILLDRVGNGFYKLHIPKGRKSSPAKHIRDIADEWIPAPATPVQILPKRHNASK